MAVPSCSPSCSVPSCSSARSPHHDCTRSSSDTADEWRFIWRIRIIHSALGKNYSRTKHEGGKREKGRGKREQERGIVDFGLRNGPSSRCAVHTWTYLHQAPATSHQKPQWPNKAILHLTRRPGCGWRRFGRASAGVGGKLHGFRVETGAALSALAGHRTAGYWVPVTDCYPAVSIAETSGTSAPRLRSSSAMAVRVGSRR